MKNTSLPFTPVIIIGAGRSGTNALRDMLCRLPNFSTWPCDEINPIWRHGNPRWPNDALPPQRLIGRARNYIRSAFYNFWKNAGKPHFVVEKTCANTLRVPFVDAALPEARYINILRNGLDVAASAEKRWQGKLEVPSFSYFTSKLRYVPVRDLPVYAAQFFRNRISLLLSKQKALSVWGPRFEGLANLRNQLPLLDVCAQQWAACVAASDAAFAELPANKVITVRYEDLVSDPTKVLNEILNFLEASATADEIVNAASHINTVPTNRKVRSAKNLTSETQARMAPLMARHGYCAGD